MIFAYKTETGNILDKMSEAKLISESSVNAAEFLCGLEKNLKGRDLHVFAAAAALVSEWALSGSICITKKDIGKFSGTNKEALSKTNFPDWEEISEVLSKSSCCSSDPFNEKRPVVFYDDRIYFYKYWFYEESLAKKVMDLSRGEGNYAKRAGEIKSVMEKLFDEDAKKYGEKNIEQQKAAETVINHRFSVITGGPGTGKTTTVAKILAGILSVCPEERIILAAPTGKAASRMTEALGKATKEIEESNVIDAELLRKIKSVEGQTIHRIIGKKFGKPEKNRENPIYAGLIIVDEASMIDISMFLELIDALSEKTSLIILGDKDQLASVDAGNVLADICSSRELLPEGTVSELKTSHRFDGAPGIGELAKAVNGINEEKTKPENIKGTVQEIIDIHNKYPHLKFSTKTLNKIVEAAASDYGFLADQTLSPEKVLEELNNFKILCPSKEDPLGVVKLNEEIEQTLKKKNPSYNSRPIMITRNDHDNTRLVNGDCGVILERNGRTKAWFKQNGDIRSFNISELPAFETVYAMTIHKSQGSEYDSVLVVLPEKDMQILTKELFYTAITRAKKYLETVSSTDVLQNTLERSAARNSGFENALKKLDQNHE